MKQETIDLQRRLIGSFLLDENSYITLDPDTEIFTDNECKNILEAIKNTKPDAIAVEHYLGLKGIKVDVVKYIYDASHDPEYHYQILKEAHEYNIARRAINDALQDTTDVYSMMDRIDEVRQSVAKKAISKCTSDIIKNAKLKSDVGLLYTGDVDVDHWYKDSNRRGYMELTIADSGHGKTQYAMWKVKHLLTQGYKVLWFQLEGYDIHTAEYFMNTPNRDNLWIADSLYNIEDIKAEARSQNMSYDLDCIVIDYVQNVECRRMDRMQSVEYISQQLTRLAKDCNVMMHLLSQITINYTTRAGWKQEPTYGDVRWSQQLKQDAHVITSVFRPSRIESLRVGDQYVKDFRDNDVEYDSVFVRQAKMRHAQESWDRIHLVHREHGLEKKNNPLNDIVGVYFD